MNDPLVASIGTTHPWNIAGVGLDARIGWELGVRVVTAVAAVSAQDAHGVRALHTIPASILRAQLRAIPWDDVRAVRIGALTHAESVTEIAAALRDANDVPAVVDPVIRASSGEAFADDATMRAIREKLLTLPNVIVTPNLDEAARLLGAPEITRETMRDASCRLRSMGVLAVLLKGGHLAGEPADVLAHAGGVEMFVGERASVDMRATGCTLAMSLACSLARGEAVLDAVISARRFVRDAIERAPLFQGLHVPY
ncbi:MAG: hydroxymethylpyrimidine/phosphomethylpyrimidine kinase [Candidatus Eremiobacteraeota bacterium]|nr:hydroxymethylpyrimidine/phosphomethylpyrimidine kinase [Candidatus Eremiobacteraeota bacterium]